MQRVAAPLTRRPWHGKLRIAMAAVLLAALALSLAPASPARATPLDVVRDVQGQGLAMSAGGVGLRGLGADTRSLSVSIGGPVQVALLYWAGRDRPCPDSPPGSGVCVIPAQPYKDQLLRFDGVAITGTIIGTEAQPASGTGPINNIGYLADVTAIVQARGAGQQTFGVADGDLASNLFRLEGAGLLVLYTDPAVTDSYRVIVFDGLDFAFGADPTPGDPRTTAPVTFNHGASSNARPAELLIFAGGGEAARPDRLDISNNPSVLNGLDGSAGIAWDADSLAISVPAGVGTTTVQLFSGLPNQNPDAFLWTLSALRVLVASDPPVAAADSYSTAEDTPLTVAAPGVLGNDSDPEGSALTAVLGTGPTKGTLALNPDGSFTYTPGAGFSGTDSFTYRASDGMAVSNTATVSISVTAGPPPPTYTLSLTRTAGGSATGGGSYAPGSVATLAASPEAGFVFTGWTLDGQFVGWASPLTLTMDGDHAAVATFAMPPAFPDVDAGTPYAEAIAQLAARGVIRGYADGRFGPGDTTLRAQMAALIARAMGWDSQDDGNPFPDRGNVDADLWRNVGTLAFYDVARGYPDGTFKPTAPVLNAQVISFVSRAMVARGYWAAQPDNPALYSNVPAGSGHREDLATYVTYAGAVSGAGASDEAWAGWDNPSTRGWHAAVLWQALDSYWGVDRVE